MKMNECIYDVVEGFGIKLRSGCHIEQFYGQQKSDTATHIAIESEANSRDISFSAMGL